MENGINKKGFFDLKVEPHLRPISDLGIGFYNLDENTATLRFQLSNSAGVLLISDNNLMVYGYFKSSNGSVSDVIELDIVDGMNGVVEITLDQDFLHASTSTKVVGQVYIGVKNVSGKPEYNEVAVLGEFDFEVKDALINKISSFTKIEYIRMFSQLKRKIEKEVQDIQDAIANGADYVAEMKSEREQGVKEINKTVTDGKAYIDNVVAQYRDEVTTTKDDAISEVTYISNNAKTSVTETASGVIKNINNISNDATEHIDGKVDEFNGLLETEGFITPEELGNQLDELEWQKYKFIDDSGVLQSFSLANDLEALHSLKTGVYYRTAVPIDNYEVSSKAGFLTVIEMNVVKHILFRPYNSRRQFLKRYYQSWNDWEEVGNNQYDTGWVTFDLINGAKSNVAYKKTGENGFDCSYRTVVNGSETKKMVRLNGNNFAHGQQIASLPSGFCKSAQKYLIGTPRTRSGGLITILPDGKVIFDAMPDEFSNWLETDYIYGQFEWTE